jgi:N-carbamoylputrescine amidase
MKGTEPMAGGIRVAGIQMASDGSQEELFARAEAAARKAAGSGAHLACLYELFAHRFFPTAWTPEAFAMAETLEGATLRFGRRLAQECGMWMIVPFFERDEATGRYYNSVAAVDPDGRIRMHYRKMHLPLNPRNMEQRYFSPGEPAMELIDVRGVRAAVMICYDRHYPELARVAALKGAHVIMVPSSIQRARGRTDTWRAELVARAVENGVYVVGINRTGSEGPAAFVGNSVAVDPYGSVIAELGGESGLLLADIDPALVRQAQEEFGHLRDLRSEAYLTLLNLTRAPLPSSNR